MRRFLAYLIMMLTAIGVIVFNIQSVLENTNDAMEFGRGTELVYSLSKRNVDNYDSTLNPTLINDGAEDLKDIDIANEVMERLDLAGVRNADVQVVEGDENTNEGYELRVTISPLSETELNNVKLILGSTGTLTIGTFGDDYLLSEDGGEFFDTDEIATLIYNGTTPYPAINVLSTEVFDELSSQATTAGENHANDTVVGEDTSSNSSDSEEDSDASSIRGTTLYLWMNKTKDDTFAKAYGVNDEEVDEEVKKKVIAEISVSDFDSNSKMLVLSSDIDGNAFTISTARAFVNALNATDYGFDIEYLYQNSVAPSFGNGAINLCYLVAGVAILVVAILMVLLFGISGLTGAVTLVLSGFVSLWLISLLGFEFSIASIAGIFVTMALSLFISANYFIRVRQEFPKKETLEKANREGYRKSFFIGLDTAVVLLIVSLFGFLFATGSFQTFFGTIMIGTIVSYLLTNYLNKWATYWLVKDSDKGITPYFQLLVGKKEKKAPSFVSSEKKHPSRFLMPIIGFVSFALLAVSLPASNALSGSGFNVFNNSGSYAEGYTLNINYTMELQKYDSLENSNQFLSYLVSMGIDNDGEQHFYAVSSEDSSQASETNPDMTFIYYPNTASFNVLEKKDDEGQTIYVAYFSVDVDRNLNNLVVDQYGTSLLNYIQQTMLEGEIEDANGIIIRPGQDPHYVADSLIVGSYVLLPTNVYYSSVNLFLLVFLLPVFAAVYILIRYGILASLAGLVGGEAYSALLIGLLSATRVPFNSYSAFGILAGFSLMLLFVIPVLGMNKVILKERGIRRDASAEVRAEITNVEADLALPSILVSAIGLALLFLSFFFLNADTIALGGIGLVASLLVIPFLLYFLLPLYHFFSVRVNFRKIRSLYESHREKKGIQKAKPAADGIVYVDEDSPHETIVPGLNDFLF